VDRQQALSMNQRNIDEFRSSGGRIAAFGNAPVLLLTTTGSRSGERRTAPMMYRADEENADRVFVFASAAGADRHPAWYGNLVADPSGLEVEIGDERLPARATVLEEPERSTVYAEQARRYPGFGEYERRTERTIPVVALDLER
jgi:deazaflavin-dependent oxidoreductase (nitroreductase family)